MSWDSSSFVALPSSFASAKQFFHKIDFVSSYDCIPVMIHLIEQSPINKLLSETVYMTRLVPSPLQCRLWKEHGLKGNCHEKRMR